MIRKNKKRNYLMVFVIFINIITMLLPKNQVFGAGLSGTDQEKIETSVNQDASEITTESLTDSNASTTPSAVFVDLNTSATTSAAAEVDTTVPIITLLGDSVEYVPLYSNYTDPGVTITDDQDTGLTATVTYTKDDVLVDNINTSEEGSYIIHYNVSDSSMNNAVEVTRTVIVESVGDEPIPSEYNVEGYDVDLQFSLLSDEEIRNLLENPDETGGDEVTTPAAVSAKINGTQKVGNTLSGELISEDGNEITTDAAVTYEWYRLDSKDSEDSILVGNNKDYKLVSSDGNKYIKLIVYYEDKILEAITSKIANKSSSSSSSSSSNNHTTEPSNNNSNSSSNDQSIGANSNSETSVEGWKYNSNGWTYTENGHLATGWKQINNSWYLLDNNGIMEVGWEEDNSTWYYLKNNGAMATGWEEDNGAWYYLKSNGAMATGWEKDNGAWYYLKSNGAMATGWEEINGTWYYLKSDGTMATGWQEVNGVSYYLNDDGSLEMN